MREGACKNSLLGTAVGDSIGLPFENMPRKVTSKIEIWRPSFWFSKSVLSDDTEHAFLVSLALSKHSKDAVAFSNCLRGLLIRWFWSLPPGIGLGTGRSILKLTFGGQQGIASAGNGAAMRAPIIGCFFAHDEMQRLAFVEKSTLLTHTDRRALIGAHSAALAASMVCRNIRPKNLDMFSAFGRGTAYEDEWQHLIQAVEKGLEDALDVWDFCLSIGIEKGVTGYIFETMPVVLFTWLRYPDNEEALVRIWQCGGDTDSTGAILGGIIYACQASPPKRWLEPIVDLPLSVKKLSLAGDSLDGTTEHPNWSFLLFWSRNMVVFPMILVFAFFVMMPRKYYASFR